MLQHGESSAGNTVADLLIVGAGLAGSLLALRVRQLHPGVRLLLIDGSDRVGGNHTWSFHEGDVGREEAAWLSPLLEASWPAHSVRFPGHRRRLESGYRSISSAKLAAVVGKALRPDELLLSRPVVRVSETGAELADGTKLGACCVVDARGFARSAPPPGGFQKFVGLDVELEAPHGLREPVLMDATVEQVDGFRFFYLLPWTATRMLIEDTRYSDGPEIDADSFEDEIRRYCTGRGWTIRQVLRREQGALPIPFASPHSLEVEGSAPAIGVRAGLYHPTTGYSLPWAARIADVLAAEAPTLRPDDVRRAVAAQRARLAGAEGFYLLLNRMLFQAARPERRVLVLQRFYRLAPGLLGRFFAGESTFRDRLRVLAGWPPVPIHRAALCLVPVNR